MRQWTVLLIAVCALTGCDDDKDIDPQTRGFIQGTLTGTRSDNTTPIDETFNYPYTPPSQDEISFSSDEQIISVDINQTDDPEGDPENFFSIFFLQDRDASEYDKNAFGDTPFFPVIDFRFTRPLEGNKKFIFQGSTTFSNLNQFTSFEIINFMVDESRGEISFDFTFVLQEDFNSSGNEATISGSAAVPYIEEVF